MPTIRFDNLLGIVRNVKAYLSVEGGVTRGPTPEERWRAVSDQIEAMRRQIQSHESALEKKNAEISRLRGEQRKHGDRGSTSAPVAPKMGALPDFILIGAQKSGTSSFYRDLTKHPYVGRSTKKEVHFFDHNFDKGLGWYMSHFPAPELKDGQRTITGEASPYYLAHSLAPERASKVVPQAKLITLLRDPVDRAYSHYQHAVRFGNDRLSFEDAIAAEGERTRRSREKMLAEQGSAPEIPSGRSYLARGVYVDQLLAWDRFFDREQMLVLKAEDYFADPPGVMKTVLEFLDLPEWEPQDSPKVNVGGYEDRMKPETREKLQAYFGPHNQRLYEHLGRDLGW